MVKMLDITNLLGLRALHPSNTANSDHQIVSELLGMAQAAFFENNDGDQEVYGVSTFNICCSNNVFLSLARLLFVLYSSLFGRRLFLVNI
jgi:hypothetical protein